MTNTEVNEVTNFNEKAAEINKNIEKLHLMLRNLLHNYTEDDFEILLNFVSKNKEIAGSLWSYPRIIFLFIQILVEPMGYLKVKNITVYHLSLLMPLLKLLSICAEDKNIAEEMIKYKIVALLYPYITKSELCESEEDEEALKLQVIAIFTVIYKNGLFSVENEKSYDILPLTLQILSTKNSQIRIASLNLLNLLIASETGYDYALQTPERFDAIHRTIFATLEDLINEKNGETVKLILTLYLRLSEKPLIKPRLSGDNFITVIQGKNFYLAFKNNNDVMLLLSKLIESITKNK